MIDIEVSSNAADVSSWLRDLFADQIPFATAKAVNSTALSFQANQRERVSDRFTVRRPWVLQGVKINRGDFATKRKPEAIVRIDSSRDFLVKFEEGDPKRPRSGTRLAIPDEARRTKAGVVSRTQRPRAQRFRVHGRGPRAIVFRGDRRMFMIHRPGGRGDIFQRVGRRGRSHPRHLFTFAPSAQVDAVLGFEGTARRTVKEDFEAAFSRAFDAAVRSAR